MRRCKDAIWVYKARRSRPTCRAPRILALSEAGVSRADQSTKPRTVLVVDDDPSLCRLIHEVLTDEGYQVEVASDGREAVTVMQSAAPELLITDLVMPDLDGTELIQISRKQFPHIAIIAMSGGRRETDLYMRVAMKLGANHLLAKPFDLDELLALVESALREPAADASA